MSDDRRKGTWKRVLFWGGMVLVVAVLLWIKFRRPEPISPLPTEPGENAAFDEVIARADKDWLFVFETEKQVLLLDIYGKREEVLWDVSDPAAKGESIWVADGSLSPDGRFYLCIYLARDASEDAEKKFCPKGMLLDLSLGTSRVIPLDLGEYRLTGLQPTVWLSSEVFVLPLKRYDSVANDTTFAIKRFDIREIERPQLLETYADPANVFAGEDGQSLIIGGLSRGSEETNLRVLREHGIEKATEEEKTYFLIRYEDPSRPVSRDKQSPKIEVVPFLGPWERLEDTSYAIRNCERDYIMLDDRIAYCSLGDIIGVPEYCRSTAPIWDSDLGMFFWCERRWEDTFRYYAYFMDAEGHYRFWREGIYRGKVLRNQVPRAIEEGGRDE